MHAITIVALISCLAASIATAGPKSPTQRSALDTNDCPCCRMSCLKPWIIPDRWDDTTVIPGHEDWANNGKYDAEPFDDVNGNGLYDPGEPYKDQNGDGIRNEEFYHPFRTGYVAAKDLGKEFVLKPGLSSETVAAGQYNAVDLSDAERLDATGNRYEWDIVNCNPIALGLGSIIGFHPGNLSGPTQRGVEALIAQDPDAYYDSTSQTVVSQNPNSPRVAFQPIADPRTISPGRGSRILIEKIGAMFIESIDRDGNVMARFIPIHGAPDGQLCPPDYPAEAAFISTCAP
jgi:hypothetical protein